MLILDQDLTPRPTVDLKENNMIEIKNIKVTTKGGKSRLSADIVIAGGGGYSLWFEVEEKYGKYLCDERCDAFVLGLLHYALQKGEDIVSEVPMTRRLYEQLTDQFLPAFVKANKIAEIHISAPLADEVEHPDNVYRAGSGVSCGVDSLHVFAKHQDITHGCIWNMHGITSEHETAETRTMGWRNLKKHARAFVDYIGRELVIGDTNFDRRCLPGLQFDGSITYGNLFCVYAMQKFWSRYYIASGYDVEDFNLTGGVNADPAHYEYLLLSIASLGSLTLRLDGVACNRREKVGDLVAYEPAKQFLTVCWQINEGHRNCTHHCPKCMRTMLELDSWGAVDVFADRFDVKSYREHPEWFIAELYRGLIQHDPFAREVAPYFPWKRIPFTVKMKAGVIVVKKITRKILRRGRVNRTFRPD